jgi:hypothetical protein
MPLQQLKTLLLERDLPFERVDGVRIHDACDLSRAVRPNHELHTATILRFCHGMGGRARGRLVPTSLSSRAVSKPRSSGQNLVTNGQSSRESIA